MIRLPHALALAAALAGAPALAEAPDPAADVEARAEERGLPADRLVHPVREAGRRGLPVRIVADKVLEGIAKGVPPDRVAEVAAALVLRLSEADSLLARAGTEGLSPPSDRSAALADLAHALGVGVDRAALDALVTGARSGKGRADAIVAAASALGALARRGVPVADALALGRALAADPRAAADVAPAFDAWRAAGGRDHREFLGDAERSVSRGDPLGGRDRTGAPEHGPRDDGRDERGRWGGEGGRPHGRRP